MRTNDPVRLRQCLLSSIAEVWCLFVNRGQEDKLAAVQVWFAGGEARAYVIRSHVPVGWHAKNEKAWWVARSLKEVVAGEFDLRDREQAMAMALELEQANLDRLKRPTKAT
jgi:hypothetical protein